MRPPANHDQGSLEIKMTPMIDVVFLLLVFFVWTSSFELPEFDLPSAIAETADAGSQTDSATPERPEPFDEIVIHIRNVDQHAEIKLGHDSVSGSAELLARLTEIIELGVQPAVIVHPEATVKMATAIEVYDTARLAGFTRVLFAAKAE